MIKIFCKIRDKDTVLNVSVSHLVNGEKVDEDNAYDVIYKALNDLGRFISIESIDSKYFLNKDYIFSVILSEKYEPKSSENNF